MEARLEFFCSCPYSPDYIPFADGVETAEGGGGLDPMYIQGLSGLLFCRIK